MEFFKELLSVVGGRVKSNIFGYTFLAFLVLNWQPLFFLLFADASVLARFTYFDLRADALTLFVFPVLSGILLTLSVPWISLAGAYAVAWPVRLLRGLQDIEFLKTSIQKAELEAKLQGVIERKKIDEAKILDEAKGLENRQVREKFERDIRISRRLSGDPINAYSLLSKLDDFHMNLLLSIGASKQGKIRLTESRGNFLSLIGANEEKITDRKNYLRIKNALNVLVDLKLLSYNKMNGEYTMTSTGYEISELANEKINSIDQETLKSDAEKEAD